MQEKLKNHDSVAVDIYERYVQKLQTEKDRKTGQLKNPWATKRNISDWVYYFQKVASTGLYIDGENITISNNGISLNYQAYKNLVLLKYPEATFDVQLVRDGDDFSFKKENGKINYTHELTNPFGNKKVIGGYCVVKVRTGEFIEVMSFADLEKVRATAKTQYIWNSWTDEMYLKSLLKRACKRHFRDITESLDIEDNQQYDPTTASLLIEKIEACETVEEFDSIREENQEAIQELYLDDTGAVNRINKALGKKEDEFFIEEVEKALDECSEYDNLDLIYANYEKRIDTLKANDRKHLTKYLGDCKNLITN